eukprot:TRINITY_DN116252_c0_g1_i2.p1 TRINITY_DN116252_c0_g1~~TRINITY_DN116252_c0_g1_i2.p1  ORF type:complete len:122 (-),score=6.01 TRINITY_DN116252_c0_g1_i2:3-368(-)
MTSSVSTTLHTTKAALLLLLIKNYSHSCLSRRDQCSTGFSGKIIGFIWCIYIQIQNPQRHRVVNDTQSIVSCRASDFVMFSVSTAVKNGNTAHPNTPNATKTVVPKNNTDMMPQILWVEES